MEMDQKPNLKFNRISNLYVRHMFARLHSNALLNRHDFISRFFQVNTRGQRDFFQGTRRFSRKRGKENGGEAWLLSGNLSAVAKLWMESGKKKKRNESQEEKRNCMGVVTLRLRSWFYFRERWIQRMVLS